MRADRRPPPALGSIEHTQAIAFRLAGFAVAVTFALALYARSLDLLRTDIPLHASNGRPFWTLSLLAALAVWAIVRRATAGNVRHGGRPDQHAAANAAGAGLLPALVVFAALQLVAWDSRGVVVVSAPLLAGVGVFTAIVVRHYLLGGDPDIFAGARLVHSALTSGVAFLALSIARGWMAGPIYTFVVVLLLTGLLMYQAFDGIRAFQVRRAAYAVSSGVVLGEAAMALTYWPPAGWYGGMTLTVIFVVMMLTIEAILTRRVAADIVTRYVGAGVGLCGLLMILDR